MLVKDFIKKNKIQLIILTIVFLILFWYIYQNKKKEHLNAAAGAGAGAGVVLSACCIALCPCIISLVILYYITKKAVKAAIKESSVSLQPLNNNNKIN